MAVEDPSGGNEAGDGTGWNGRSYPQHEELLGKLPPNFQEGFRALQEKRPSARVVCVTDDDDEGGEGWVFISLGIWEVDRFADYDRDHAEVFVRVKDTFPKGKKYGMVTDPPVKVEGQYPDGKTEVNREKGEPLRRELGADKLLFWSRDWRRMNLDESDPSEMQKAVGLVRGFLREPLQDSN
jgi:hypothetical protein